MTGFSDNALLELLTRFALTLLFNIVQMRIVSKHAPESRKNVYSFFIISVVVFFLANALGSFNMQIGMAIGMFAVFGIVRYRTDLVMLNGALIVSIFFNGHQAQPTPSDSIMLIKEVYHALEFSPVSPNQIGTL